MATPWQRFEAALNAKGRSFEKIKGIKDEKDIKEIITDCGITDKYDVAEAVTEFQKRQGGEKEKEGKGLASFVEENAEVNAKILKVLEKMETIQSRMDYLWQIKQQDDEDERVEQLQNEVAQITT